MTPYSIDKDIDIEQDNASANYVQSNMIIMLICICFLLL